VSPFPTARCSKLLYSHFHKQCQVFVIMIFKVFIIIASLGCVLEVVLVGKINKTFSHYLVKFKICGWVV